MIYNKITDAKMFELADDLKRKGKIRVMQEFCDGIGIDKQSLRNIRIGKQSFTINHLIKASQVYKVRPDWLFGLSARMYIVNKIVNKNHKQ